ncbi:MAG: hypothetical protein AAF403_06120 [Pseudomonadota bacterium]
MEDATKAKLEAIERDNASLRAGHMMGVSGLRLRGCDGCWLDLSNARA